MKSLTSALLLVGVAVGSALRASGPPQEAVVTLEPFEPPREECFDWGNKYSHPKEIIAPIFSEPSEMQRAGVDGEVLVLVQIDENGFPKRLSVLSSTNDMFSRAAILDLKKARWGTSPNVHGVSGVWFYYRAIFTPGPESYKAQWSE